jgi:hypothetical protein
MTTRVRTTHYGITETLELGEFLYISGAIGTYLSNDLISRCMEHAIHLGTGHFIQMVSPTSAHALVKKFKKALRKANIDIENIDFDAMEDLGGDNDDDDDDDDDEDAASEISVGDTIGKALALVKQVSTIVQSMQIGMC